MCWTKCNLAGVRRVYLKDKKIPHFNCCQRGVRIRGNDKQRLFFKYRNTNTLNKWGKITGIYSFENDTKQQTKAREVIINDIPEHLALCTAELDNK